MDSGCWYCGKPALEVWHTTWDVDGQEWPMCEECAGAVRIRLDLRARGLTSEADLGDERHGIDTRGIAGKWIVPEQEKADMIKPYWTSACGRFVIYCGDCLEVMPTLGKVDAVVTDPPYGIKDAPIQGQERTGKRTGAVNNWHAKSNWDNELNSAWWKVCETSDIVLWFGQWRKREAVSSFIKWPLRAEIVWAKDCHVGPPSPLAPRDERIWVFSNHAVTGNTFETSVWDSPIIPTWEYKHHKNEKPLSLFLRLLRWLPADSILDPFMGSGTTGVACARLGRKFIGIEIIKEYCDIAVERIKRELSQPRLALEEQPTFEQAGMFENDSET